MGNVVGISDCDVWCQSLVHVTDLVGFRISSLFYNTPSHIGQVNSCESAAVDMGNDSIPQNPGFPAILFPSLQFPMDDARRVKAARPASALVRGSAA